MLKFIIRNSVFDILRFKDVQPVWFRLVRLRLLQIIRNKPHDRVIPARVLCDAGISYGRRGK